MDIRARARCADHEEDIPVAWLGMMLALPGVALNTFLSKKKPLELSGTWRKLYLAGAVAVNLLMGVLFLVREVDPAIQAIRWFLTNLMLLMAATDLREMSVYDLHFRIMLLGGAVSAFLQNGVRFWEMYLLFAVLYGALKLLSRKNSQLGMGDSRMIACLALYFPFARWAEILILSLFFALIYGVTGIIRKKKTTKSELPFAPFLLIGTLADYFF